jgi:Fe-S-cluster-containing dehydrogenase component
MKVKNLYAGPLGEKKEDESLRLQRNPNVTVRMRGVIEKCTYCVQRIESAKILQKQVQRDSKNFRVPTDSVKTACQQSCPAEAIVFGDLADKKSVRGQGQGLSSRLPSPQIHRNTPAHELPRPSAQSQYEHARIAEAIAAWSNNQY